MKLLPRALLPLGVCLFALAAPGSRIVHAQPDVPIRWVGTITVKMWMGSGTPANSTWEFTVSPRLREERIDVVEAGRTVGQLVMLKDDGSTWRGAGGGAGGDGLTTTTQSGSGAGVKRDTFAWVYRSLVTDDPMADLLPDGSYALSDGGSTVIEGTITMSSPFHESVTPSRVPLTFFIGRYFPHQFQGSIEVGTLKSALARALQPGQAGVALDTEARRLADDGRMRGSYAYRHPVAEGPNLDVTWEIARRLDLTGTLTDAPDDWRPLAGAPATFTAAIDPSLGLSGRFRFRLSGVSREPGYALNAGDGKDLDLIFSPTQTVMFEPAVETSDGWTIETSEALTSAEVSVLARDYGAWGRLSAEILIDGEWYDCLSTAREGSVAVPRDDNGNHIADTWEREVGLVDAEASADIDATPAGAGSGDGFSNYEEYRGFVMEGLWQSTDPAQKELFVYDEAAVGAGFFPTSGIVVLFIDPSEYDRNRIVNFNRGFGTAGPQKGLHMVNRVLKDLIGEVTPRVGPPNVVEEVRIDQAELQALGDVALDSTIAHELGHAVSVEHHGHGVEQGTCGDSAANVLIATWRGAHSGNRQCVMVYGDADYYRRADRRCEPFMWPGSWGGSFCASPSGTDINAGPERRDVVWDLPLPVSGDARVGSCAHRISLK